MATPAAAAAAAAPAPVAYVGVDVAKARLDVFSAGRASRLANTPAAAARFARALARRKAPPRVVVESTGGYERPLLRALLRAGVAACHVNPLNVRLFARGLGRLAKTDPIDARVLARYGELAGPMPLDAAQFLLADELKQLVTRRRQLADALVAQRNHLEHATSAAVRASVARVSEALEAEVAAVEAEVRRLVEADGSLRRRRDALATVPGVGELTASVLVTAMPELGRRDRKSVVALAGLAPYDDSSGSREGVRRIRGGRPDVRRALYMSALVGLRHNPVLREHYKALRANGKPGKVALVACMRKLLLHLNAILAKLEQKP